MPSSGSASYSLSAGAPGGTGRIGCACASTMRTVAMYAASAESTGA
ncbi:MAG: hypothetical protein HOQ30_15050 [Gemmatimonadaceae bacterium]|nr:hypothetical protein [Gemmatimonadaceae bacterium]